MAIALAINGAAGRMGRRIIALARDADDLTIAAAAEPPDSTWLGRDAGEVAGCGPIGVAIADRCSHAFDVMIYFSTPDGAMNALEICVAARKPLLSGTTGLSPEQFACLDRTTAEIAVLHAPNMSIGVNVLLRTIGALTTALGAEYDVEIVETHHRHKPDAPSGTALAMLEAVKAARSNENAPPSVVHGRHGAVGARPAGEIGVHAVRLGDTVGRHVVSFGGLGETIRVEHEAQSRDTFARGALRAARWLAPRRPGRYTMQDVLFSRVK